MDKILTSLRIINKRIEFTSNGSMYVMYRFNPYNPLTYVIYLLVIGIGFFIFGLLGVKGVFTSDEFRFKWKEISKKYKLNK